MRFGNVTSQLSKKESSIKKSSLQSISGYLPRSLMFPYTVHVVFFYIFLVSLVESKPADSLNHSAGDRFKYHRAFVFSRLLGHSNPARHGASLS